MKVPLFALMLVFGFGVSGCTSSNPSIVVAEPIVPVEPKPVDPVPGDHTASEFSNPNSAGEFADALANVTTAGIVSNGNGFIARIGITDEAEYIAQSGLLDGTQVTALPTSGFARYGGIYYVVEVSEVEQINGKITGTITEDVSGFTLDAHYNGGTLTGASFDGSLIINGTFTDQNLGGGVSYRGVQGDLSGLIGGNAAIGAFHGNDSDSAYAGGFDLSARP